MQIEIIINMATSKIIYTGKLRTQATHIASGEGFITDAPVDNGGKGEAFSPTDLVATALGACAITIVGKAAETHGFTIDNTQICITKIMKGEPRRIGEIVVEMNFPSNTYTDKQKSIIRNAVKSCPVALSLHPDIVQTFIFNF